MARTLQELEVPILGTEECDQMFHEDSNGTETVPLGHRLIYKDMICAGYPDGNKDTCQVIVDQSSRLRAMETGEGSGRKQLAARMRG